MSEHVEDESERIFSVGLETGVEAQHSAMLMLLGNVLRCIHSCKPNYTNTQFNITRKSALMHDAGIDQSLRTIGHIDNDKSKRGGIKFEKPYRRKYIAIWQALSAGGAKKTPGGKAKAKAKAKPKSESFKKGEKLKRDLDDLITECKGWGHSLDGANVLPAYCT